MARRSRGPIEAAVVRDIAAWHIEGQSALKALAITLGQTLDEGAGLATAAVARELRAALTALRPPEPEEPDALDDLIRRLSAAPLDAPEA
jgi:hypothetical protein